MKTSKDTKDVVAGGNISGASPANASKKFRCSAKTFAITYSQCDLDKDIVKEFLKDKRPYHHVMVAREKHQDGNWHLHAFVRYIHTVNIKSERFFDFKGFHPNFSSCRNAKSWLEYITKFDIDPDEEFDWDETNPHNFIKREADYLAWRSHMYRRKLDKSSLNDLIWKGHVYPNSGKRRHLCIVTPPDSGKTTWFEDTFEGRAVYKITGDKYPFDRYSDEEVIVFDDYIPPLAMLLNISNTYKTMTPVYGNTRYTCKYYKPKSSRWIILLLNYLPTYYDEPAFQARFQILT